MKLHHTHPDGSFVKTYTDDNGKRHPLLPELVEDIDSHAITVKVR